MFGSKTRAIAAAAAASADAELTAVHRSNLIIRLWLCWAALVAAVLVFGARNSKLLTRTDVNARDAAGESGPALGGGGSGLRTIPGLLLHLGWPFLSTSRTAWVYLLTSVTLTVVKSTLFVTFSSTQREFSNAMSERDEVWLYVCMVFLRCAVCGVHGVRGVRAEWFRLYVRCVRPRWRSVGVCAVYVPRAAAHVAAHAERAERATRAARAARAARAVRCFACVACGAYGAQTPKGRTSTQTAGSTRTRNGTNGGRLDSGLALAATRLSSQPSHRSSPSALGTRAG